MQAAEMQLTYKVGTQKKSEKITTQEKGAEYCRSLYEEDTLQLREYFYLVLLDRANRVLGHYEVSRGGTSGTLVDMKFIVSCVCLANASAVILTHNHPSGQLLGSSADKRLTDNIQKVLKLLDVVLLDHIIITEESYLSFSAEGQI